ncbi:hypothetical protein BJX63DRAFT_248618 [Aspergillus granulosus]|uniref:Zn(2)-C6 fungal-type domain-containing protein n=1 Tax=Aspergillus granulosus TaxID=176169 RepID=A0ABR4H9Z7_9EURO
MPPQVALARTGKAPKIRRGHSGCKACRKRGKRCDETKPCCRACVRLKLDCSYAVDYSFRNHSAATFRPQVEQSRAVSVSAECSNLHVLEKVTPKILFSPTSLDCGGNLEATYWSHFEKHVLHLLPGVSIPFMEVAIQSPSLRFAALCLSASNLSMLNAQVQRRTIAKDRRRCVSSPLANKLHHAQAQRYHEHALTCSPFNKPPSDPPADLAALVLLAYYHHASTDHLKFRLAVWESVQFALLNKDALLRTMGGRGALQMWYRLCISHRLSKPPPFMLEGEGPSAFGPNRFPDTFDQLFLSCILSMSADDLIYDILIKTIEIRSRLVLFRSVAGSRQIPEYVTNIGSVAYTVLNKLLGRCSMDHEEAEAEQGFVRGSTLLELLEVQKQRLQVWRSRLTEEQQLPGAFQSSRTFSRHRDAMNALYCILCEMIFEEAGRVISPLGTQPDNDPHAMNLVNLANTLCQVAGTLNFNTSNMEDIYTFSLAETLFQLVLVYRSEAIFHSILDIIWPQMESKSRGYEHSHYPTHLVKRIITEISRHWAQGRDITFAQPAVPEDMPKLRLLDIDYPIHLVVCGYDGDGGHFIERIPLP